jgi:hypothetical protein
MQWRGKLAGKQATIAAQPVEPHHREPALRVEWVLTVDLATTQARARGIKTTISHERRQVPTIARATQNMGIVAMLLDTLPAPSVDGVDRV